jgi:hypothetical protein
MSANLKPLGIAFAIGQTVSLKADPAKKTGMIRGVTFRPVGYTYLICWGYNEQETYHYEIELQAS